MCVDMHRPFGTAGADHSLQLDNQGFSFLDWVLAKVSVHGTLQIFVLLIPLSPKL